VGNCSKQAGDRRDRVLLGQQEQGVSAATDAGIGIGSGQLMQHLLLRTQIRRHSGSLLERMPLYPGPELLSNRLAVELERERLLLGASGSDRVHWLKFTWLGLPEVLTSIISGRYQLPPHLTRFRHFALGRGSSFRSANFRSLGSGATAARSAFIHSWIRSDFYGVLNTPP
jgi:hypothetical protein